MKSLFVSLVVLVSAQGAFAKSGVENCFLNRAEFFASDLETISQSDQTPVLLLNAKKEVVGVVATAPKRDKKDPNKVAGVEVYKISLCSTNLEVNDFYYADGKSFDLGQWAGAGKDEIQISQDEGLLVLNASIAEKSDVASLVKVTFKGYDVFSDEDHEPTPTEKNNPDYIKDWGLPKGKGEFYFYLPANWTK